MGCVRQDFAMLERAMKQTEAFTRGEVGRDFFVVPLHLTGSSRLAGSTYCVDD